MSLDNLFERTENLGYRLQKLRLVAVSLLNLFYYAVNVVIHKIQPPQISLIYIIMGEFPFTHIITLIYNKSSEFCQLVIQN